MALENKKFSRFCQNIEVLSRKFDDLSEKISLMICRSIVSDILGGGGVTHAPPKTYYPPFDSAWHASLSKPNIWEARELIGLFKSVSALFLILKIKAILDKNSLLTRLKLTKFCISEYCFEILARECTYTCCPTFTRNFLWKFNKKFLNKFFHQERNWVYFVSSKI